MYPFRIHFSLLNANVEFGPYTLFFLLAIVTVLIGCTIFAVKRGFHVKKIIAVLAVMLISAIVGARILNALINIESYIQNPAKLFEFSAQGFSVYGGILFAVASGYICCRLLKLNPFKLGDTFIPFLGIGIAVMRVGCFLQGCCFGKETDLPWAVKFPLLSPAHLHQMFIYGNFLEVKPVHPTQLYELLAALLLSVLAFAVIKRSVGKSRDGMAIYFFLTGYSLFRLFNSYLRVDPDTFTAPFYFYPALYLSIAAICIFFIVKTLRIRVPAGQNML